MSVVLATTATTRGSTLLHLVINLGRNRLGVFRNTNKPLNRQYSRATYFVFATNIIAVFSFCGWGLRKEKMRSFGKIFGSNGIDTIEN